MPQGGLGVRMISPEVLARALDTLHPRLAVTVGSYEVVAAGQVRDLDWNHMDQSHRPHVHKTYEQALRVGLGGDFGFSVTKLGKWPVFIPVTDIRLRAGLFYQCLSLFGLFYIHSVIEMVPGGSTVTQKITWYIVSHKLLRFMHPMLNWRLHRLNHIQNREDASVRARREALRQKGFGFACDEPNFLTANNLTNNVIFPRLDAPYHLSLAGVDEKRLCELTAGPITLLVKADKAGGFLVWSGECPHEGGPLACGELRESQLRCPWHGLMFAAAHVTPSQPRQQYLNLQLALEDDHLVVAPALETASVGGEPVR